MNYNGRLTRLYDALVPAHDVVQIERLTFAEYRGRIEERLGSRPHGSEMPVANASHGSHLPIVRIVEMRDCDAELQE